MVGSPAVAGEYGSRNLPKPQEDTTNNLGKADLSKAVEETLAVRGSVGVDNSVLGWRGGGTHGCCWQSQAIRASKAEQAQGRHK